MNNSTIALALAMTLCGAASANVVTFGTKADFDGQGTIVYNSNFSDFGGNFTWPSNPFTRGDVTYTSAENLTVGAGTGYSIGNVQTVMTNNYWSPLTGTISSNTNKYDLFGFDAAVTSEPVSITLNTNLGQYLYSNLSLPNGSPNFAFEGFKASAGEYFTGFRIDSLGSGYLVGMTNVEVGVAGSSVPEPATILLTGLGLIGLFAIRRKKNV